MDKIEEGLNVILSSVIGNIPSADWENASLNVCALNKIISMRSFYEETGNFISFDPEENGGGRNDEAKKAERRYVCDVAQ